ncbi:MAG: holo-ACP synthase [Rhizobacter sp.]
MKGVPLAGKINDPFDHSVQTSGYSMLPAAFRELTPFVGRGGLRTGLDVVEISRISASVDRFGSRFMQRLFREDEIAYALSGEGNMPERLAARFAAKEAAIKAFDLAEAGVAWRDIEVRRLPSGACELALHGKAALRAAELGVSDIALSLSHDGDYAAAIVTALVAPASSDFS